jgi:NADH-quinone oxidoreductase subunit J
VHSVLFLILTFFNAAGLFLLTGAEFLAMILLVVYVGAVAVLFLFVVMMLDVDFAELKIGRPAICADRCAGRSDPGGRADHRARRLLFRAEIASTISMPIPESPRAPTRPHSATSSTPTTSTTSRLPASCFWSP